MSASLERVPPSKRAPPSNKHPLNFVPRAILKKQEDGLEKRLAPPLRTQN